MRTARLISHSTINLYSRAKVDNHTSPEHPHYIHFGGFGMFVDDQTLNELTLALVQRMYDTNTHPSAALLDTLAHLTHVMADGDHGYAEAAADAAYDQYVDDAAMGV